MVTTADAVAGSSVGGATGVVVAGDTGAAGTAASCEGAAATKDSAAAGETCTAGGGDASDVGLVTLVLAMLVMMTLTLEPKTSSTVFAAVAEVVAVVVSHVVLRFSAAQSPELQVRRPHAPGIRCS